MRYEGTRYNNGVYRSLLILLLVSRTASPRPQVGCRLKMALPLFGMGSLIVALLESAWVSMTP